MHPGRDALAVELCRVRGLPWRIERHLAREPVEAALCLLDIDEDRRVDARDRAPVAADASSVLQKVVALGVRGEGLDPELPRERREPVLGGPDPLAAHLHDLALADVVVEQAPAHAL